MGKGNGMVLAKLKSATTFERFSGSNGIRIRIIGIRS
jgi:hypothetical protein